MHGHYPNLHPTPKLLRPLAAHDPQVIRLAIARCLHVCGHFWVVERPCVPLRDH